jgi:hypothetical protein
MMDHLPSKGDLDDAPIWGAGNIAKEIRQSERTTFYMLERKLLPAKKIGNRWVSNRRALRRHLAVEA